MTNVTHSTKSFFSAFSLRLRALVFYCFMVLSVIVFTPLSLLPIPYRYRYNWFIRGWCRFNVWTLRVICGVSHQVAGLENIPTTGGVVLACKHQSAWEIMGLITILPMPVSFVYKRELIYLPLFGQVLFTLKMIPIDRQQGSKAFAAVCKKSKSYLTQGHVILMFPEGTRTSITDKNPTYRSGVARLALSTKTPVIPISLNSGFFWRRNAFMKTPGCIDVVVHPVISAKQLDTLTAPQLTELIKQTIEQAIK
jgi:1-acyl-sn-glycerol-3-phosphate acyltransferase